jgi:hypothetical protein
MPARSAFSRTVYRTALGSWQEVSRGRWCTQCSCIGPTKAYGCCQTRSTPLRSGGGAAPPSCPDPHPRRKAWCAWGAGQDKSPPLGASRQPRTASRRGCPIQHPAALLVN